MSSNSRKQFDSLIGVDISSPGVPPVDIREALPPIKSLLGKSEKAFQKLTLGTWQHAMLEKNIAALHVACRLMGGEGAIPLNTLQAAEVALADMTARTEEALAKFEPGTSQHTLQRNRLKALRMVEMLVRQAILRGTVA